MTNTRSKPGTDDQKQAAPRRTILTLIIAGLALLVLILAAGDEIGDHVAALEAWISGLGPMGMIAFVGLYVLATSLMLPESVFSVVAGALFGLAGGLAVVVTGAGLAAVLQYALARRLLRAPIERVISNRPTLAAIQRAVLRDETRLQVLLRLTPLNPATISYMLGAGGARFGAFLLACLGLFPHLFGQVYMGYAGKHAAHMASRGTGTFHLHDLMIFGGLAMMVVALVLISRTAHKAVVQAVSETKGKSGE